MKFGDCGEPRAVRAESEPAAHSQRSELTHSSRPLISPNRGVGGEGEHCPLVVPSESHTRMIRWEDLDAVASVQGACDHSAVRSTEGEAIRTGARQRERGDIRLHRERPNELPLSDVPDGNRSIDQPSDDVRAIGCERKLTITCDRTDKGQPVTIQLAVQMLPFPPALLLGNRLQIAVRRSRVLEKDRARRCDARLVRFALGLGRKNPRR